MRILGNKNISTKPLKHLETKPSAWPTELKVFTVALENCKKSLLEHFTEKPILLNFESLSTSIFYPRLYKHLFQEYLVSNIWNFALKCFYHTAKLLILISFSLTFPSNLPKCFVMNYLIFAKELELHITYVELWLSFTP